MLESVAGKTIFALVALAGLSFAAVPMLASESEPAEPPLTFSASAALPAKVKETRRIDYRRIDERIGKLMEERAMVGLAVGIVEDGEVTFLKGYGETEYEGGEGVTSSTVFRWASVSKGVAGTVAAQLERQGKVMLDAPIARYSGTLLLPEGAQVRATVRDVLSHRLGLWRNAYDDRLEDGQDPRQIRRDLGTLILTCQPGTCWSYQNVAFDAASDVVEKATGEPYPQAIRHLLFDPLGMDSASASRDGLVMAKSWARPHSTGRRVLEVDEDYFRVPAAGGVNSDIKDMALWLQAQMGLFPDILPTEVIETAHRPLVATPVENRRMRDYRERLKDARYGLGWRIYDYEGRRLIGHRGGVDGYRSFIMFDPEAKTGVVAMWNSNTGQPHGLQFEVLDLFYGLEFRDWLELD